MATPDSASLSPSDAIVALRSFGRRFRAIGVPEPDDEDDTDAEPTGGRIEEALASAAGAASAIAAVGEQLQHVLVDDSPAVGPTPDRTRPAVPPADAIERLEAAAAGIADLAARQPPTAWSRTGRRAGSPVTAADLLREAVRIGAEALRAAGG